MEWILIVLIAAFLIRLAVFVPQVVRTNRYVKQQEQEVEVIKVIYRYIVDDNGDRVDPSKMDVVRIVVAQTALLETEARVRAWRGPYVDTTKQSALLNFVSRVRAEWVDAPLISTQELNERQERSRLAHNHYLKVTGHDPDNPPSLASERYLWQSFLFGYPER